MSNYKDPKTVFEIVEVKKDGISCPAIRDIETHEFDPLWVAGCMFSVLDRYLEHVDDSQQHKFIEDVQKILNVMIENGHEYTVKIKDSDIDKN